jgi:hypothetical protein
MAFWSLIGEAVFVSAFAASKEILSRLLRRNWTQGRSRFVVDPATGTLIVKSDCRLEIERALCGAARGIALRRQMRLPHIRFRYFALNLRDARLRVSRKFRGYLFEFASNRHRQLL